MLGVECLPKRPSAPARARPRWSAADKTLIPVTVELPAYVRERVDAHILDNPGTNLRFLVLEGFQSLGIAIDEEDLIAERKTVKLRQREARPVTQTTIRLPRYVRGLAEEYLLDHPEMRLRHLVMAGFRSLGIEINDEDLIAERQNVAAATLRRR